MLPYLFIPIEDCGGEVALHLLLPLLILALLGKLLEEVLFRGFLQNFLKHAVCNNRSITLSRLIFGEGHLFIFYGGLVCAYVLEKYGLMSATITHGLAIFIFSAGLI